MPEPSGEEGLADVRVIRAIPRSCAERRAIRLPAAKRGRHPSSAPEIRRAPAEAKVLVGADAPSGD